MGLIEKLTKNQAKDNKPPKMVELAVNESNIYSSGMFTKYNPDSLVGRKGLIVYDKMRIDDTVKSSLILKKYAVLAPNFKIVPATDSAEDIEVAKFVEYCFESMQGSIYDSILQILTALDYGYSVSEINYAQIEEGEFAGKIGLASLKTKYPHNYMFDVDKYSNIKDNGLVYTAEGMEKKLPTNKFLIYSYQKEFGNPYGNSDLRSAYRGYWSKDVLIKFWNIYLERYAMPTVVGEYASNDAGSIGNLRKILDNLTAKTAISHRMGEFDIKLLESQRNSTNEYRDALNFYNKMIARSILIPDRLFAEGETGAYAQSKIHFDVFLWVVEKLRQDMEEIVMKEQLLKRLIGFNYQNVKKMPSFKFNPLTDEQRLALNEMFINAVSKGVVSSTEDDENYIRESLNFPTKRAGDVEEPQRVEIREEEQEREEEVDEEEETLTLNNSQVDLRPTEAMAKEGEKALKWRKEFGRGGTAVGIARAAQLKNRENLSPSTVKRMHSFFSRHEVDKKAQGFRPGEKGYPSNGRIAWAMWGGDPGQSWARSKRNQLENRPNADEQEAIEYSARDAALKKKVADHNEKYGDTKTKRTSLRTLRSVYNRGIGAYRTNPGSVRPTVKSKEQWALARVNSFLYALRNGRFRSGKHDNDLFPAGHPLSSKKNNSRFLDQVNLIIQEQRDLLKEFISKKLSRNELTISFIKSGIDLKKKQLLKDTIKEEVTKEYDDQQKQCEDIKIDAVVDKFLFDKNNQVQMLLLDSVQNDYAASDIFNYIDDIYEENENIEEFLVSYEC